LSSLLNFRKRPAASDGFYRRLAEAIIKGEFRKKPLRKKPFVELFPTQTACPHCKGKRRKSWGTAEAERLVNDVAALARQIKRKQLCLVCLAQLSEISKLVGKQLKEPEKGKPEKKDPQSLSPSVSRRVVIPLFLGAIIFPPLLIPATFIIAMRKRGVYWVLFIFTTSFFLCFLCWVAWAFLAVLGLPSR